MGKSFWELEITEFGWGLWLMNAILATWEAEMRGGGRGLRPAWAKNSPDPISKISKAKCAGGMAQVV
jgi:hypothetical protein